MRNTSTRPKTAAPWASSPLQTLAAGIVVFALQWMHGPADAFVYDAAQYWEGALALLNGGDVTGAGVLEMRGALSPLVYLLPALVTTALGPWAAAWSVLAWNALLAVVLLVVLIPRIAEQITPGRRTARVWVSALLGGIVLSGFARFPLLDVWSVTIALAGLYALLVGRRWFTLAAGGLALAVAVNLRPSYLVPVMIAAIVLLIARPRHVVWAAPGAAFGASAQALFNITVFGQLSFSPVATPLLLRVQAAQATYGVRYDTVVSGEQHPQQWYCDPAYAGLLLDDHVPTGPLDVVMSAVSHLPQSLWFLSEKASSSLFWTFGTPYEPAPGAGLGAMTIAVVAVAAFGVVALIWRLIINWSIRATRLHALALLGFWFGALGTLVFATPETRFALPLVLVGLIGLLVAPPAAAWGDGSRRSAIVALAAAVALSGCLLLIGESGLDHPVPPGPLADADSCAELTAPSGR
ncbi:MAG TPA: hypothetical protein PKH61_01915 [Microbacteriaceae bacterium]|nr:hypothetical protein [Microbacteriaceae bacterium]HQA22684.1 hypothetical protein [Rhodoglobus sp.]HQE45808.1 hypothetical protein [Rhodoglobus sp.]